MNRLLFICANTTLRGKLLVCFMVICIGLFWSYESSNRNKNMLVSHDLPSQSHISHKKINKHKEVLLSSKILPFVQSAKIQFVEPTPLKLADLKFANEEDDDTFDDSLVVLDKVVVIPENLLPAKKHWIG